MSFLPAMALTATSSGFFLCCFLVNVTCTFGWVGIYYGNGLSMKRGLTAKEKIRLLDLHNHYRRLLATGNLGQQPKGADLTLFRWNHDIEKYVQNDADQCDTRSVTSAPGKESAYKYNFGMSEHSQNVMRTVFKFWVDIPASLWVWNLTSGSIGNLYNIDRYLSLLSVIWNATESVACGYNYCSGFTYRRLVCSYRRYGAISGYQPYTPGEPCSKCPGNYTCFNYLCMPPNYVPFDSVNQGPCPSSLMTVLTILAAILLLKQN